MESIKGKIQGFNISPKGSYESMLVESNGNIVQINFPKDATMDMIQSYKPGKSCTVSVKKFKSDKPSSHVVYDLAQDQEKSLNTGIIKSINYARHGEPNGVILESGELVHMKPEGAKMAKLAVGKKITFEGKRITSPNGLSVIEASAVNGAIIKAKK